MPDLLERDFTASAPNEKLVGDLTYLPCADGQNLYLATVIDCFARRLVGWSIADHMRTAHVADALLAAAATRGSLAETIVPGDHGAQYTSRASAPLCGRLGMTRSMGAVGSSADNALTESFNATLKREPPARDARRRIRLEHAGRGPAGAVRLGHPPQHPPPALRLRAAHPERLRGPPGPGYAANRGVDTPRVSKIRGQGPRAAASDGNLRAGATPLAVLHERRAWLEVR